MNRGRFALVWLSLLVFSEAALAQVRALKPPGGEPPACTFPISVRLHASLKTMPQVANELKRQNLDVADVGEPFVPYDVYDSSEKLPHRQFVRGYVFADRTVIWYYHGGFGGHVHVVEFRKRPRANEPDGGDALNLTGVNLLGPPCKATQAIVDGVLNFSTTDW